LDYSPEILCNEDIKMMEVPLDIEDKGSQ